MDFKVNQFTTITDFERLDIYESFMKFGKPSLYERFKGKLQGSEVQGWINVRDNNIYKLEKL